MNVLELPLSHQVPQLGQRRLWLWLLVLASLPSGLAALAVFGFPPWPPGVWVQVGLTCIAHALAFLATFRTIRYPGREEWGVAASYLLFFSLLLIAVLAMGRLYYSRVFLLLSSGLALGGILLYLRHLPPKRLAFLPGGVADLLPLVAGSEVRPLSSLRWEEVEGVVADLHRLPSHALPLLAEAALRGRPILHAVSVYEGYTGRVILEPPYAEALAVGAPGGLYPLVKRVWEVAAILLFAPLILLVMLWVAFLVYLDLGRPILFAQERMGLGGRPFKAYKFRTMKGLPRDGVYAGDEASRITPLGRILRRYRLDELPQLWNVLKGEMSLIGPRPEQGVLAKAYAQEVPFYSLRHLVRPGLTGWAQVHHGYAEGKEGAWEKLSYDLYYVKHMSFWLDMRIVFRTVWVILTGFGAK